MKRNLWITALLTLLFVGAQVAYKKYQYRQLENETMRIHDEAMVKLPEMNRLARLIKKELVAADTLPISTGRRDSLEKTLQKMEAAENDMLNWMSENSKRQVPAIPLKDDINALEQFKLIIEKNKTDILFAIEEGKQIVK